MAGRRNVGPPGLCKREPERMLERARIAHELVHELEVNLAGASVILRLREEMVVLRQSVRVLALEVERTRTRDA